MTPTPIIVAVAARSTINPSPVRGAKMNVTTVMLDAKSHPATRPADVDADRVVTVAAT
jgi:hypothetical protein